MHTILEFLNRYFTLLLVFPGLLFLGLYLTMKLRCVQLAKLKLSLLTLFKKEEGPQEGNISHYQAVASVLASNFGTGNISGMAVALTTGGPGALIWMWVMTFLGAAVQFANCLLGVKYRRKNKKGEFVGGPMYYLSEGLGLKRVAIAFSIFVLLAAIGVGDFVQVNSVALPLQSLGISPWISGVGIALLVAVVVLGGAQRVAQVSSLVVPIMALLYMGAAGFILWKFKSALPAAFTAILTEAFSPAPLVGGFLGFSVLKALTTGFDRAIFATDAGTGTVPLLQSGAKTTHPVVDGIVSLLPPFLVMVVCSATALVLMVTEVFQDESLKSTNMVIKAFSSTMPGSSGLIVVLVSLFLFGYTTTLAWATCIERAMEFLFGGRYIKQALIAYILLIPVGAVMHVNLVWIFADIALTAMLICNMIGVFGLSKEVIIDTKAYFTKKIRET